MYLLLVLNLFLIFYKIIFFKEKRNAKNFEGSYPKFLEAENLRSFCFGNSKKKCKFFFLEEENVNLNIKKGRNKRG